MITFGVFLKQGSVAHGGMKSQVAKGGWESNIRYYVQYINENSPWSDPGRIFISFMEIFMLITFIFTIIIILSSSNVRLVV